MFEQESQWMPVLFRSNEYLGPGCLSEREDLLAALEADFEARFPGFTALILPSGRAALAILLHDLGIGRGDVIAAPRWSSACVWSTLGRFGCPTVDFNFSSQATVLVHKYGFVERLPPHSGSVIEDACDSLVIKAEALLLQAGMAEIVSLPKILGTYGGGLVLLPKGEMADRLRPLTRNFSNFNASQGFLRWKETTPSATVTPTWDHLEFQNFAPDATVLKSIREGVAFWDARAETIQGRLAHVAKHRPDLLHASPFTPHEGRLPCVLPIPRSSLLGGECGLSVRRMNCSGDAAREDFHPMVLLPLHSGFSEHAFLEAASRLAI